MKLNDVLKQMKEWGMVDEWTTNGTDFFTVRFQAFHTLYSFDGGEVGLLTRILTSILADEVRYRKPFTFSYNYPNEICGWYIYDGLNSTCIISKEKPTELLAWMEAYKSLAPVEPGKEQS